MVVNNHTLMSVREVALKFSITQQQVLRAIRSEKLPAHKIGWTWVIDRNDLPKSWSDLG